MASGDRRLYGTGLVHLHARNRRVTLAALLLLSGAVVGFSARCAVSALLVNVGHLAVLHGAADLATSAFDAAVAVDPASPAAGNFRLSQALVRGDYRGAADELVALRARGAAPRGVANSSSVLLHLDAILARRTGDPERALALIRESVARAGVNAPREALRLLDQLSRDAASRPYAPSLASVVLVVDPRRNSCGGGRRLAQVRLLRNDVAVGGPLRVELEWTSVAGEPTSRDVRVLRNLAPNGGFTWGATETGLPLGYAAHPLPSGETSSPSDMYVGFVDLNGQAVSALVVDNLDSPPRTSRLRSNWIPATPGACYLLASEVWTSGGNPHFGVIPRSPAGALGPVFGLQGPVAEGWRREARLVRLAPNTEALQVFFWNLRASGVVAFSLAIVARLDA